MQLSQQLAVALAIGSANAWVLPFPIPTITIPQFPTQLPTELPTFTIPGFPNPFQRTTTTKATSVATTSSKATPITSASKSSSTFGSAKPSSIVSGSSIVSSPKSSAPVTTSKSVVGSTSPVISSSSGPYLPPGQTGTLQSPTCILTNTSSIKTSASAGSSQKSSVASVKPSLSKKSSSSGGKVPSGRPSSTGKAVSSSSAGKVSSSSKVPTGGVSSSHKSSSSSAKVSTGKISSTQKTTAAVSSSTKGSSSAKTSVSVKPSTSASVKVSSSKKASSIASSVGTVKPVPTGSPSTSSFNTTSGTLRCGTASNVTGVTQCLGIPFAQPPVGDLRFAAPVAYTSSKIRDATKYGADCPATLENVPEALGPRLYGLLGSLGQVGDTLAEDCLFLNVWTKTQKSAAKKPVLVWIYGGGFEFGGSAVDVYSGKYFAQDEDVVFVSLNYRVNILGFSGAPNQTQNVGLLDQRLAIEWVRDNIAAFGGDPEQITIFGQSAGGASVDLYRYAWTSDPIIAGAVPMSGTADSFAIRNTDQGAMSWYTVTTAVGCGNSTTSTDPAILACMRNASVDAIEKAAAPNPGLSSLLGNFGPVIDGKTVFTNYTDLGVKGNFIKKPTLTGNLNYESGLFILIAAGAGQSYPQSTWDYIDEQVFTCPVSRVAEYSANAGVPTWRYYYSGMYPNELIPTANISQAWHTAELPNLFGTTEEIERNAGATVAESANTQPQAELAKYIRHAWATFAANPTSGLSGSEFGWPQYSASGDNVVFLGQNNQTFAYGPSTNITGPCQL